jgi:orotate phosphoribosyltransferase
VIVVDDVVTTGATMRSAAAALRHAGASEPRLYAIASTPSGSVATARRRPGSPARPTLVA